MQRKQRQIDYIKIFSASLALLCAFLVFAKSAFDRFLNARIAASEENLEEAAIPSAYSPSSDLYRALILKERVLAPDVSLLLYRSEQSRADVESFYARITDSEEISRIVLENADKTNIPAALAFSLAWEESRYQPKAVNRNSYSVDRGLFQLNSKSFPDLTEADFFDPAISAYYGLSHLNLCFEQAGNEVAALAMYNAGSNKVRANNTPQRTLDYVSRILSYRDRLNELFNQEVAPRYYIDEAGSVTPIVIASSDKGESGEKLAQSSK